jgi:hypothetical protein
MSAHSHLLDEERDHTSREPRLNVLPSGRYLLLHAAGACLLRRRREATLEKDPTLRAFVRDRLAEGRSRRTDRRMAHGRQ